MELREAGTGRDEPSNSELCEVPILLSRLRSRLAKFQVVPQGGNDCCGRANSEFPWQKLSLANCSHYCHSPLVDVTLGRAQCGTGRCRRKHKIIRASVGRL